VLDGAAVKRVWEVAGAGTVWLAAEIAADFPAGGTAGLEVSQLGQDGEPGAWARVAVGL